MRIGIDVRLVKETGVGRYIRNLLRLLAEIDKKNSYILYVLPESEQLVSELFPQAEVHTVPYRWHSLAEQVNLPGVYLKDSLDLLHVPYFTVPLAYRKPFVTTVHDLTILRVNTGKATTLPYPLYLMKKLGYQFVLNHAVMHAKHIFAVSETTKQDLLHTFPLDKRSITTTYEGVELLKKRKNIPAPYSFPYLLYVGNVYPHKNLETLLRTYEYLQSRDEDQLVYPLVIIGKEDYFVRQFRSQVQSCGLEKKILFAGEVEDTVLASYYISAHSTISPSKAEGFALPLLEALLLDCPILASDIPVFRELLPKQTRFVSNTVESWANAFKQISNQPRQHPWKTLQEKDQFFDRYSWKRMAEETLQVYETCVSSV